MSDPVEHGDAGVRDPARPGRSAAFFERLVEAGEHATLVFAPGGDFTYASPAAARMMDTTVDTLIGSNFADWIHPPDLGTALDAAAFLVDHPNGERPPLEVHLLANGVPLLVEIVGESLLDDPDVRGVAIAIRDIRDQETTKQILDAVMRAERVDRTLRLIAELGHRQFRGGGVVIDLDTAIGELTEVLGGEIPEGLRALTTTRPPGRSGLPWEDARWSGDLAHLVGADLRSRVGSVDVGACWSCPIRATDGLLLGVLTVWMEAAAPPSPAETALLRRLATLTAFAIERWSRDQQLEHAAGHDLLTDLPNRSIFTSTVARRRNRVTLGLDAILFVDLDGFKAVNDTLGHAAGDEVLVTVAARMSELLRSDDTVARLGGDEFAVLCPGLADVALAALVAERLIRAVERPIETTFGTVQVGASVGIAVDDGADVDLASLLNRADSALYLAKGEGKGCWRMAPPVEPVASSAR